MANTPQFETFPVRVYEQATPEEAEKALASGEPRRWHEEYGWHFRAGNARLTATAGESFTRREDAERAIADHCIDVMEAILGPEAQVDVPTDQIPIVHLEERPAEPEAAEEPSEEAGE